MESEKVFLLILQQIFTNQKQNKNNYESNYPIRLSEDVTVGSKPRDQAYQ
jgi:hypothetical protein